MPLFPNKGSFYHPLPEVQSSQQQRMENLLKATDALPDDQEAADIPLPKQFLRGANEGALITRTELTELNNLHEGVKVLRRSADQTNANCQGFINSVEYFVRGKGYNQVRGTDRDLNISDREDDYDNQEITPVACWTAKSLMETGREFWSETNFFEQMKPDVQVLKNKRFLLLKVSSMRNLNGDFDSSAGHYANLVTLKSGRLAVIDGQSDMLFPVFNPDGTPTPRAKEYFKSCRIQLMPVDTIDDNTYTQRLKTTNQYMEAASQSEQLMKEAEALQNQIKGMLQARYQATYQRMPDHYKLETFMARQPEFHILTRLGTLHDDAQRFLRNPRESQTLLKNMNLALSEMINETRQRLHD